MAASAFGGSGNRRTRSTPLDPELLSVPYANIEDDTTLWQDLKGGAMSGLVLLGQTLNKASRATWGSANYLRGRDAGGGLLNLIPGSDTMGWTDPDKGVELSNFLTQEGMLAENDPTAWEWGDASRLAADIIGDPLTWVGPGLVGKGAGKTAKAVNAYDDAIKATMKAKGVGPRVAAMKTTLRDALGPEPSALWQYAEQYAEANKLNLRKMLDKPLGTAFEVGGFGKTAQFGKGKLAEVAAGAGDFMGQMWRKTPVYTAYRTYFDHLVRGQTTRTGQEVAEAVSTQIQRAERDLAGLQIEAEDVITSGFKDFDAEWARMNPRKEFAGTGLAPGDRVIAGGIPGEIIAKPGAMFDVRHVDPETGVATFAKYKKNQIKSTLADMTPDELIKEVASGSQRARVALEAVEAFGPKANEVMRLSDAYAAKWAQGTGYAADDFYGRLTYKKGDPSSVGAEALMQGGVDPVLDRLKATYPDLADARLKGKYGEQYLFDVKFRGLTMVDPRTGHREMAPLDPGDIDKYVQHTTEWADRRLASAPEPPEGYRSGRNPFDVEDHFGAHPSYIDGLPKKTQDAVSHYKQAMPIETVGTMRGSRMPTERGYESTRLISDAIYDAPPLDRDTVLYRSLPMNPGDELNLNGKTYKIEKLEPGSVLTSKAPVSTSYSRHYVDWEYTDSDQAVVQFLVPKGSKALAVDAGSSTMREAAGGLAGESEVLLPPGTQFKVVGKQKAPSGREYIQVEVVSQSKPNFKAAADLKTGDTIGPWEIGDEMAYQKFDNELFRPVAHYDDAQTGGNIKAIYDIVNGVPDGTQHLSSSGMMIGALYHLNNATDEVLAEAGLTRNQAQNAAERIRRMNMASNARPTEVRLGRVKREINRMNDTVSLFQPGRGAVEFDDAAKTAVITAFEQSDITTMTHELGHVFRRWLGESDEALLRQAEEAVGVVDGEWTREAEEVFSQQFEKYLQSGTAPVKGLKAVFSKLRDWISAVYQGIVGTPLEQRINPKLKDTFDKMLSPKAQKKVKDSTLLAQSRSFAAFNQLVRAAAEGQDLRQAWGQITTRLRMPPGATIGSVMGEASIDVGRRLKQIQDEQYDAFLRMGGKGELMQDIPGGVDHFFRGVSQKIAKEMPDTLDASLVGGRKFGAVKSRAEETRNISTGTINEMLTDTAIRKAYKNNEHVSEIAKILQAKYVDTDKMVLDPAWKADVPMEQLRPFGPLADRWEEAVADHMAGTIDDVQLKLEEDSIREAAHLEDVADYITRHKEGELYTRDPREDMLTYLSGVTRAKAAMSAIHESLKNAVGTGSVSLESAYRRAGMDPEYALDWLSEMTGRPAGELAKANVPEELVQAITGVQKLYNEKLAGPGWKNAFKETYDKLTNAFKAGVTVLPVTPAYFTRNYFSGQFMNLASGLVENAKDMLDYGKAVIDAMSAATSKGNEWTQEVTQNWVGRNQALAGELAKEQALATGKMGLDVRPPSLFRGKNRWAEAKTSAVNNPILENAIPGTVGLRTAWGAAVDLGQDVNAWVEWMNRVPLYIYLRKKGWAETAALHQVDRLHFDYGALAPFEKEYMRRLIPFYSFSRRLGETVVNDLIDRPGGAMAQFIKRSGNEDFEPDTPEHIVESLALPLEGPDPTTKRFLTGTGMPYEDTASLFGSNPLMEIGSRLNPIVKAPIELAMGRSFFQGRDLEDMDGSLGRIGANIMGKQDAYKLPILAEQAAVNLPTARIVNSVRTLTDPRKTLVDKGVNLGTGFRITDVSERSRDAVLADRVMKVAKKYGARTFERPYFKKPDGVALSPDQTKLNDVFRALAERSKIAKEKAAGKKKIQNPLQRALEGLP